jgi:hypothetical protein
LNGAIDRTHPAGGDESLDFITRKEGCEIGGVRSYEAGVFVGVAHGKGRSIKVGLRRRLNFINI